MTGDEPSDQRWFAGLAASIAERYPEATHSGVRRGLVLSETRLRAAEISYPTLHAKTYADAALALVEQLSEGPVPRRLSALDADLLVLSLLRDHPELTILSGEVARATLGSPPSLRAARAIRSTLDAIRLELRGERILGRILDEFGEVQAEEARFAELLLLEGLFVEAQRERGLCDTAGLLELLAELLRSAPKAKLSEALPCAVVLDQPTHLFALEREIWGRISQIAELYLLLDSEAAAQIGVKVLPSSLRQLRSVYEFLNEWGGSIAGLISLPPCTGQSRELVAALIDGAPRNVGTVDERTYSLTLCEERRDEAEALALCVRQLTGSEQVSMDAIHLATPDVEPYRELLRDSFAKHGMQLRISKAKSLVETAPGDLCLALLQWIEDPTLGSFERVATHQFFRPRRLMGRQLNELVESLGLGVRVDPETGVNFRAASFVMELRAGGAPESLADFSQWERRLIARLMLSERSSKTEDRASYVAALAGLVVLREHIGERERVLGDFHGGALEFGRYFRTVRHRLRELRGAEPLGEIVNAVRQIRPLLREVVTALKFLPENTLGSITLVGDLLKRATLSSEVEERGVLVTELLDIRGLRNKTTILFGLTAESFPAKPSGDAVFSPASEAIGIQLLRRSGAGARGFESLWLFAHALRSSKRLLVFAPCSGEQGELPPAHLVKMMDGVLPELRFHGPELPLAGEMGEPERLLRERREKESSIFTGNLTERGAQWTERRALLPGRFDETGERTLYSVSELETFLSCSQRFYFQHVLKLPETPMGFEARLRAEVGSIVHRALERFTRAGGMSRERIAGDFAGACQRLAQIAEEVLAESAVDWESEAVIRDMRREILGGLDGSATRRGYLLAALQIQRELLSEFEPIPELAEYSFSKPYAAGQSRSRLRVAHEMGEFEVRGVVDRIDRNAEGELSAVWDYKTGSSSSRAEIYDGRALQVPLYALAVAQNFSSEPREGGVLDLKNPELSFPSENGVGDRAGEGFVRSHLTLSKSGPKFVIDPAVISLRTEAARNNAIELDKKFRQGDFSHHAELKECKFCSFQSICSHDGVSKTPNAEAPRILQFPRYRSSAGIGLESKADRKLEGEQDAAANVEVDIALLAGAGSGKTHVLRGRVLRLLKQGAPIESILAITFTEKAAFEIRERIELAIAEALLRDSIEGEPLTDEERANLREAQSRFSEAIFGTIHSLAGKIVKMDPELAGFGAGIEVASPAVVSDLVARAIEEVVFERGQSSKELQQQVEEVLARGISRFRLKSELLSVLYDRRKVALLERLSNSDGEAYREELLARVEELRRRRLAEHVSFSLDFISGWRSATEEWLGGHEFAPKDSWKREHFVSLLSQCTEIEALLSRAVGREDESYSQVTAALADLESYVLEHVKAWVTASKTIPKPRPNYWKDLRDWLHDHLPRFEPLEPALERDRQALQIAVTFAAIAVAANSRFAQLKRDRGVVDFDDLITGAAQMVGAQDSERSESIRRRLQARFRHLMVDEFQDTDPEQWSIVRAIADVKDEQRRSLFVVGDVQQSIYSFRGGDVRVFNDAIRFITARGGKELTLTANYRTVPPVVSWVNDCFDRIFAMDFDSAGVARVSSAVRAQRMRAERSDVQGVRVSGLRCGRNEEAESVAWFVAEVMRAIDGDECREGFERYRELRDPRPGPKIAVLCRAAKDLHSVAEALEARGVPFSLSHSEEFFELDEIRMFENLLRALADPWDSVGLVGVLRSPLVGLNDLDLVELATVVGWRWEGFWRPIDPAQPNRFDRVREQLRNWRARARHVAVPKLMADVAKELRLAELYQRVGDTDAMLNVGRLFELVRAGIASGEVGTSAADAVRWIALQKASGGKRPNSNSGGHPVVLMTIHASKGLEFPMVVLPFLQWGSNGRSDFVYGELPPENGGRGIQAVGVSVLEQGNRKKALLQQLLAEGAAATSRAEERRVFYVACTRSRDFLAICGAKLIMPGANISWHEKEAKPENRSKWDGEPSSGQHPLGWLAAIVDGTPETD